jgi:hypothetical protein
VTLRWRGARFLVAFTATVLLCLARPAPAQQLPTAPQGPGGLPSPSAPDDSAASTTRPVPPFEPPAPTIPSTASPVLPSLWPAGTPPPAQFQVHSSLALSEFYTDNFLLTSRHQQDDFRTLVAPNLSLLINKAFTKGLISYTPIWGYDTATRTDFLFHSAFGQVGWEVTPLLGLTVSEAFTRSDNPEQADQLHLRTVRVVFTSNTTRVSADYHPGDVLMTAYYQLALFSSGAAPGSPAQETLTNGVGVTASTALAQVNRVSLGYAFSTTESSTNGASAGGFTGTENTTQHTVTASLSRTLNAFTSAGVSGNFARGDTTGLGTSGGYDLWGVSLFSGYSIPERWSAYGSVGYSLLQDDLGNSFSTVTSQSSLSYYFARGTATLSVYQGFSETFATGQNFGIVETRGVSGSVGYRFGSRITGTASAFYNENQLTGVSGGQRGGTENIWGATLSFSLQLQRWLSVQLSGGHVEGTGNGTFATVSSGSAFGGTGTAAGAGTGTYKEDHALITFIASF